MADRRRFSGAECLAHEVDWPRFLRVVFGNMPKRPRVVLDVGMPKRRNFPPFENVGDFKAVGNLFGMAGEIA